MPDDIVLIAVLGVVAVWGLLGVLVIALFVILKLLQSIRGWLERIAFGVRAIETQTAPLGGEVAKLAAWMRTASPERRH